MNSKNNAHPSASRRRFLIGGLSLTGALIVGWIGMPMRQRLIASHILPVMADQVALNGWVMIAPDGRISVAMAKSEMGQGVTTALPMLVAEELDVPLSMVEIFQAPVDKIYGDTSMLADSLPFHPDDRGILKRSVQRLAKKASREFGVMVTGGSSSIKDSWLPMREAGAAARAQLIAAAAKAWGVPADTCTTEAGFVLHPGGKRAAYGELATAAAAAGQVAFQLKDPAAFKLIGQSPARRDSVEKVNGRAQFGMDVKLPGMLYAAVTMCPVLGGKLRSVDTTSASAMPGVTAVVPIPANPAGTPAGVAVVARSWWQAKKALAKLVLEWDGDEHVNLSSADIAADFKNKLDAESGFTYFQQGELAQPTQVANTLRAEYAAPFLAHAALEPVNCTAQFKDGKLLLWVPTQVPSIAVSAAAQAANIREEDVELHVTYLGGGFGRRLETDMIRQAVTIACQTHGAPVQLVWQREDDIAHDFYRPAAIARLQASIDAAGNVLAYQSKSVSGAPVHQLMQRAFGLPQAGPDKTTCEGLFDLCYEFANQHIAHVIVDSVVPLGTWRSVGHSHNAFFKESFIDEIAHAVAMNPVDFRRRLLQNHPRHLAVLNAAVAKAGQPAEGRAHGVALHQSFGSIVAEVAEVSIHGKQIQVKKITCAVDCGRVINPDGVRQQIESGVIYGLTAALMGEIKIQAGRVLQKNFHDYPLLRMQDAPQIEVVLIDSDEAPEGVGEPGTPPVAPAVANAVFALCGKRLRSLPLRLA